MEVIRISEEQREWLDGKKEEFFNTTEVSYRVVLDKVMENDS
jgi:hypothetical protein